MLQTWLVSAYLLQVPLLHDVLLPSEGDSSWASGPSAAPFLSQGHLPAEDKDPFLAHCRDGRALADALIQWAGLPLNDWEDSQAGSGGGSGSSSVAISRQLCTLMVLQCIVLFIAALRVEAKG